MLLYTMDVLALSSTSVKTKLTSTAERSSIYLRLKDSSPPRLLNSLQCRRMKCCKVSAVQIEPTGLNEGSLMAFGRVPDDFNTARSQITHSSRMAECVLISTSASMQFSKSVQEASSTHAELKKPRILTQDAEKMRREMVPLHQLRQGGFVDNSLMYRQIFVVRSYEVGPDRLMSIREIFSLFQETALNHVQLLGIAGDGFGATRAMNRLGLIWVVTKMKVEVNRYPVWPEVVEIDTWVAHAGKNGMQRDWIMRSYQTDEVLARATSTWCMMDGVTRRLSKIPDEVRAEIVPCFMDDYPSSFREDEESPRITKLDNTTAENRRSHLKSTTADLDMNQHVNNLKYINWVLDSVPVEHMEKHVLASISLEYRRECHSTDVVESLTNSKMDIQGNDSDPSRPCEYVHLLRKQDSSNQEILRGMTKWRRRSDPLNC
ncbi:palmitoyl-acyl carrier protein thioesterase, chloroplastic [Physcomitrium patens]|uniref:Acyl-[acyl-carrier-protein] hydrolase n=2 Tax=Physcomitrium patens TaxID=3218 RepID=A0A7I4BB96_PHYPA|nr:palmitoyl-acyl carrier protein thioesterase, chloroplastic-like [Physcomitrium patens]XP_024400393.1 palmitoyl-acyl carrier protein thioesterase, chloroplastic-like [Physcomitrium patens]XP_024400394.1 palmitoyl-acyl carrier protein thioesterase, chloroplastic-like [Physcomitrium patens]|eukprot:XP_024400392.1 palmitoyl-acyl carrier protein thioesterase, chloroplastic-like [Physcomitrella patens]